MARHDSAREADEQADTEIESEASGLAGEKAADLNASNLLAQSRLRQTADVLPVPI